MRRWIGLVLVLMLLGAVAALIAQRGRGEAPAPEPASVPPAVDTASTPGTKTRRTRVQPAAPAPVAESPEPAEEDEWVVRVLDAADVPLPRVPLRYGRFDDRWTTFTDHRGEARFDRSWSLLESPLIAGHCQFRGRLTVLRVEDAQPIVLRFVDQATGDPLVVGWPDAGGKTRQVDHATALVRPGTKAIVALPLTPPEGWAWPAELRVADLGIACRYAETFEARIPVPRAASVRVRVARSDGVPLTDVVVYAHLQIDRRSVRIETRSNVGGVVVVRGLPYFRRDRVRFGAEARLRVVGEAERGRRQVGGARPIVLTRPDPSREVLVTVRDAVEREPLAPEDRSPGFIGIGGGDYQPPPPALFVDVIRRGGRPAVSAEVQIEETFQSAWTGVTGRAAFRPYSAIPPGGYTVWLIESGLVPASADVTVTDGEVPVVVLREPAGRTVEVRVVDTRGSPVSGAHMSAGHEPSSWRHAEVHAGVHHMATTTDADGKVTLSGLPVEGALVTARFGSRERTKPADGDSVTIVLPDAD